MKFHDVECEEVFPTEVKVIKYLAERELRGTTAN